MTDAELSISDATLIAWLRELGDHASFEPHMHHTAADRIEQLVATNEALIEKSARRLVLARDEGVARVEQFERAEAAETKLAKAVEALVEISDRHIPDQPAAYGGDETDWARRQHTELRRIARATLALIEKPITQGGKGE